MSDLSKEQVTRLKAYLTLKKGDLNQATVMQITELLSVLLDKYQQSKGDKGDSPIKGQDYFTSKELEQIIQGIEAKIRIPNDGKDYVLTTEDKEEIAAAIKVPIVEKVIEKTEVIKEQPIVTNEIKEVAVPETVEEIVKKLSTFKKAWLEISQIKGLQDLLTESGNNFLQQAKGFAPRALASLYDMDIPNPIDGQAIVYSASKRKWIAGAVVSSSVGTGFTLLPATGTVDGSNTDFTFTQKPTYIVSDGAWYTEGAGWSWSGLTATMSVPPQTGIWGFV